MECCEATIASLWIGSTNAFGARKMHGHVNVEEFFGGIRHFLGGYYFFLAAMNGLAAFYLWRSHKEKTWFQLGSFKCTNVLGWLACSAGFTVIARLGLLIIWAVFVITVTKRQSKEAWKKG